MGVVEREGIGVTERDETPSSFESLFSVVDYSPSHHPTYPSQHHITTSHSTTQSQQESKGRGRAKERERREKTHSLSRVSRTSSSWSKREVAITTGLRKVDTPLAPGAPHTPDRDAMAPQYMYSKQRSLLKGQVSSHFQGFRESIHTVMAKSLSCRFILFSAHRCDEAIP